MCVSETKKRKQQRAYGTKTKNNLTTYYIYFLCNHFYNFIIKIIIIVIFCINKMRISMFKWNKNNYNIKKHFICYVD